MAASDGNGWVACRCGRRHWGLHGAAGLLLVRRAGDGLEVLLQQRAPWVHEGGTWGVPGGAADSHEDAVAAALREAEEEAGIAADDVRVVQVLTSADHVDWRYDLVVAAAAETVRPHVANEESDAVAWVALDAVENLPLHPGFAGAWAEVRGLLESLDPATWTAPAEPG